MKSIIAFRPKGDEGEQFARMVDKLGVSASELARAAYEEGIEPTYERLLLKKKKDAEEQLKKLAAPLNSLPNSISGSVQKPGAKTKALMKKHKTPPE